MTSRRPDSSVRFTSSDADYIAKTREYHGTDFLDLLLPSQNARGVSRLKVPPVFLDNEMVDCSVRVGEGASFLVTKHAIPPGPERLERHVFWGDIKVSEVYEPDPRPRFIAYKTARVTIDREGKPVGREDRQALESMLTEYHILTHPPIMQHENIIDFLGLAWSSNFGSPLQSLPALVVEYGDRGTLADVQSGEAALDDRLKHQICEGITSGLHTLHQAGIVHGDLKPENVIMVSDPRVVLRPKLADFGFALVQISELASVCVGGTRLWAAPEAFKLIPVATATLCDIYSLGLVIWSVAIDGQYPLDIVPRSNDRNMRTLTEINSLKESNSLLQNARFEKWLFQWCIQGSNSILRDPLPESFAKLGLDGAAGMIVDGDPQDQVNNNEQEDKPIEKAAEILVDRLLNEYRSRILFKDLEAIFCTTLQADPSMRNLNKVLSILQNAASTTLLTNEENISSTSFNIANTDGHAMLGQTVHSVGTSIQTRAQWAQLGFKWHKLTWQAIRLLKPMVQNFVVECLLNREEGPSKFLSAACLLNGYGVTVDKQRALQCLREASDLGHDISQANLFRMYQACNTDLTPDLNIRDMLQRQAYRGSRMALEDLRELEAGRAEQTSKLLQWDYAGTGAEWYSPDRWYFGWSLAKLRSSDFDMTELGSNLDLYSIVVNQRGDHILHAAAAIGAQGLVERLVQKFTVDVNSGNAYGETALLCACRSGHAPVVKSLLDHGASASIVANTGESPLHWLISFSETDNPVEVGKDLLNRGKADVNASTNQSISYSQYPGTIDVDFQCEGTPLLWAVHHNKVPIVQFLMQAGANPVHKFRDSSITPFEYAALFHHAACLETMVEYVEEHGFLKTGIHDVLFGPLIFCAIHSSDLFSMILRNGNRYKESLKATLAYLQKKTEDIDFQMSHRGTLLHQAASGAREEACNVLFELEWQLQDLNKPAGPLNRTPIMETVRWNRASLFYLFLRKGGNPHLPCSSPFETTGSRSWSALHVFADQGHNENLELLHDLIRLQIPVEGVRQRENSSQAIETPLSIAIRRNAFKLAEALRSYGASLETPATTYGMLKVINPISILGQIISLNSRSGMSALSYVLREGADFIVEKARGLTALHFCAMMPAGLFLNDLCTVDNQHEMYHTRADFDLDLNKGICFEILEWFHEPKHLDMLCGTGQTALQTAVEHQNTGVVAALIAFQADKSVLSRNQETAMDIANRMWLHQPETLSKFQTLLA